MACHEETWKIRRVLFAYPGAGAGQEPTGWHVVSSLQPDITRLVDEGPERPSLTRIRTASGTFQGRKAPVTFCLDREAALRMAKEEHDRGPVHDTPSPHEKPTCPHCGSSRVIRFDADNDRCDACGKWFPAL